jgi:hypothetical protein
MGFVLDVALAKPIAASKLIVPIFPASGFRNVKLT